MKKRVPLTGPAKGSKEGAGDGVSGFIVAPPKQLGVFLIKHDGLVPDIIQRVCHSLVILDQKLDPVQDPGILDLLAVFAGCSELLNPAVQPLRESFFLEYL
jgi:hypothetical protein